jgi:ketol-acid reductoisomerase
MIPLRNKKNVQLSWALNLTFLAEIQDGSFAKEFVANVGELPARREVQRAHQIACVDPI